jgi:hypothetical protein
LQVVKEKHAKCFLARQRAAEHISKSTCHEREKKSSESFVQSRDEQMKEVMPVHCNCMAAPEQVKPSRRRGKKQRRIMVVYHSASRGRRGADQSIDAN